MNAQASRSTPIPESQPPGCASKPASRTAVSHPQPENSNAHE